MKNWFTLTVAAVLMLVALVAPAVANDCDTGGYVWPDIDGIMTEGGPEFHGTPSVGMAGSLDQVLGFLQEEIDEWDAKAKWCERGVDRCEFFTAYRAYAARIIPWVMSSVECIHQWEHWQEPDIRHLSCVDALAVVETIMESSGLDWPVRTPGYSDGLLRREEFTAVVQREAELYFADRDTTETPNYYAEFDTRVSELASRCK